MCTVTYIPAGDNTFITSNRDERKHRKPAIAPGEYEFPEGNIFFPKDGDAGGTWFAVHENGNLIVLLNGAFEAHISVPPYSKSRGVILLDLIKKQSPFDAFRSVNLENIEPFTLIIFSSGSLFECRWDGDKKHAIQLDKELPHIWSSATLYDDHVAEKREKWFADWLVDKKEHTLNEVLNFHQFTGDGDGHNDLFMNRNDEIFTVSITSVQYAPSKIIMKYLDVIENNSSVLEIPVAREAVSFHE